MREGKGRKTLEVSLPLVVILFRIFLSDKIEGVVCHLKEGDVTYEIKETGFWRKLSNLVTEGYVERLEIGDKELKVVLSKASVEVLCKTLSIE